MSASSTRSTIRLKALRASIAAAAVLSATASHAMAAELNIYSHRQPSLIQPFLDAYTAKTGTKINIVHSDKGLAQRLEAEGASSPADVVLTIDISSLAEYADKDLLAPVESSVLNANIPANMRDPANRWFALAKRVRVLAISRTAKDGDQLKRYEDLTDARWKGRICTRPGSHVYNRALMASMISTLGPDGAQAWANGLVANLAQKPQGNDRAQVKAVSEGVCDVALINNYYIGLMMTGSDPEQRKWADAVTLVFPNQGDRGTHVNVSGGGVAKHSKNKAEAIKFLEYLTTPEAQRLYADVNFEYPVNPAVEPSAALVAMGTFKSDDAAISRIAELATEAQKVIDRAEW